MIAPSGPPMLQDGHQRGLRWQKTVQYCFWHTPKRPQGGHKRAPSALGVSSGLPQAANIF
eukprot:1006467-Pyramimonas_sp.AAC.1